MGKGARNRQQRLIQTELGKGIVTDSGISYDAQPQQIEDPGSGEHLWINYAIYKATHPERVLQGQKQLLDMENLLTVNGPVCMKCEGIYSSELAREPCGGNV